MADTKNDEAVAPATVVVQQRNWLTPLLAALVVAGALVLGGAGGFALATVTHGGGRPAMMQGPMHDGPRDERPDRPGPGQQGPGQQGPGQSGPTGPGQGQQPGQPGMPGGPDAPADGDAG